MSSRNAVPGREGIMRISSLLAAVLLSLLAPCMAQASTAAVTDAGILEYRAAPGEINVLTTSTRELPSPVFGRAALWEITFTDPGAVIVPGAGCEPNGPHSVTCHHLAVCRLYLDDGDDIGVVSDSCGELHGGAGADRLRSIVTPKFGGTRIFGGRGDDALVGERSGESFYGGEGEDRIIAGRGDYASGGPGGDRLTAPSGRAALRGRSGDDLLIADGGYNGLFGGAGNDRLRGGTGQDRLNGGGGRDELHGGGGGDFLTDGDHHRGAAVDADLLDAGGGGELSYWGRARPVYVDLSHAGPAGERGERDIVRGVTAVVGGRANDALLGTGSDERLSGSAGADRLVGRGGDDVLSIEGADRASGGPGADQFGFTLKAATIHCGPGYDVISSQADEWLQGKSAKELRTAGPWLSHSCEVLSTTRDDSEDDFDPAEIVLRPPRPVLISAGGLLGFGVPCPAPGSRTGGRACRERLQITAVRAPFRTLAGRSFAVAGDRRRVAVQLPGSAVVRARRGPIQLRARLEVPTALGPVPLTWRFRLRLPPA